MSFRPFVITKIRAVNCLKRSLPQVFTIFMLFPGTIGFAADGGGKTGKFTITIDAGHGGKDTGAPGKKSVEKNLALGIALKLGHYLESLIEDIDVYYTRKTDVFIPLYERAQIANRNKSDLFVSIHINAVKNRTAPTGTSTYVMGFSRSSENLDLVMQENKAMLLEQDFQSRYSGFDPTSPESYILFNNMQNNNLTQSLELAASVQDHLRIKAQRKDLGVHQGNLVVLWGCAKPSILVEAGFISNPQEEEFLMSENGQDIIASALYEAIKEYKEAVDSKVSDITQVPAENQRATPKVVENPVKRKDSISKATETSHKVKENVVIQNPPAKKTVDSSALVKPVQTTGKDIQATKTTPADSSSRENFGGKIEFRIQVLASNKHLAPGAKEFNGATDLTETQDNGMFKYLSRPCATYEEAIELKSKFNEKFQGTFVVAFVDGKRVPLNVALQRKK